MGQSTDGILTFGIDLGEYKDFMAGWDYEWEEFIYAISGLPSYGEEGYVSGSIDKWLKSAGVELVQYCSCDYPMYILAVYGTETTVVSRGYTEEIDPADLVITDEQKLRLKAFFEQYINVEHPDDDENYYEDPPEWVEPKWLLASNWC